MGEKPGRDPERPPERKYGKTAIVQCEKVMARGVTCSGSDPYDGGPGGPFTTF